MVTDAQYKELQNRVTELEKKMNTLSMQLSRLILKGDIGAQKVSQAPSRPKRDKTKYMFDGVLYCKRRLAYVCIKKYIVDNNIDSFNEVLKIFPDYLQGSLGTIKPVETAEKYANAHRRFYFSDEDIIYLSDKPYVVCSQWEKKNINNLLSVVQNLGYQIETICLE